MNKLVKGLSLVWVLILPVMAHAHDGHGLLGDTHYHAPVDLKVVIGLIVVAAIGFGIKRFLNSRK